MFQNFSNISEGVDTAFVVIFSIIFFFLISLTATLIYFIYRYNEKRNPVASQIEGSTLLEWIWTVIPLIIVMFMFYFGFTGWKPVYADPPDDAMPVTATARMWSWNFAYENGRQTDTLYVPQGRPVVLDLVSMDVIHSFYVPAFRLKQDMVPGRDIKTWFIANSPGVYDIFCAEYCGLEHSSMLTSVRVLPEDEFMTWYEDTTAVMAVSEDATPASAGRALFQRMGCVACHSTSGIRLTGPPLNGIYGHEVTVETDGEERTIIVDDAYIRRSILTPNADVVDGFNPNLMQSYSGQLNDEQINDIIEFIRSME